MTLSEAHQIIAMYSGEYGISRIQYCIDSSFLEVEYKDLRDDLFKGDHHRMYTLPDGSHGFSNRLELLKHSRLIAKAIWTISENNNWTHRLKRFESFLNEIPLEASNRIKECYVWI